MKNNIQFFIDRLKKGIGGFNEINFDDINATIDVSRLYYAILELDLYSIYNFWEEKSKNRYFELVHPLYNNITSRAVYSTYSGGGRFIVFNDKTNNNPWIIVQRRNIIDRIFIEDKIINFPYIYHFDASQLYLENICNVGIDNFKFRDIEWGFDISLSSPWHFFYESLHLFSNINLNKKIYNGAILFLFDKYKNNISNDDMIPICPRTININFLIDKFGNNIEYINNAMKSVYFESMLNYDCNKKDNEEYDLTIWLSLVWRNGSWKTWLNQFDSVINILSQLKKYFKKIRIYIDGIRDFEYQSDLTFNSPIVDLNIVDDLIYSFKQDIKKYAYSIISLNKMTVREVINFCSKCDLAIAEAASGAIIPTFICKIPSILYGMPHYVTWSTKILPKCYKTIDVENIKFINDDSINYFISWQSIYNLCAEMLEEMSKNGNIKVENLNMKRLRVPSVELVAKQYYLEQQFGIKISMENVVLYDAIQDQINNLKLNTHIQQLENINNVNLKYAAKQRIQNQLSYKLGQAMIINSKSLFGYIKMPFVLSYIKDKHNQEQKIYKEKIKKDPTLELSPLESYSDYQEALKEKQCLTYKLGQALIKAHKTWYKGGYIKLLFDTIKLKKEFISKK